MPETTIDSPTTPMAREIITSTEPKDTGFFNSIESAFEKAFPGGVPAKDESADETETVKTNSVQTEPVKTAPAKNAPAPDPLDAILPKALLEPEKPAEAAPTSDVEKEIAEQTKGMSPKAADRFKTIHARATTAEKLVKELEEKVRNVKPTSDSGEVEALKKQIDEYDEALKIANIERHPKFRDAFDGEIDRKIAVAKKIAGKLGEKIEQALRSGDSDKWEDLHEELGAHKSAQIAALSTDIELLKIKRGEELSNWKSTSEKMAQMETEAKAKEAAQAVRIRERSISEALRRASDAKNGYEIFREVPGNDAWNKEVSERVKQAKEFATAELGPEDISQLSIRAVAADKYRQVMYAQSRVIASLQKEIAGYKKAEPGFAGYDGPSNDGSADANEGYIDRVSRVLTERGELR